MKSVKILGLALALSAVGGSVLAQQKDSVAENMLVYQRSVGGWPKMVGNVKVDYHKTLTEPERMATLEDAGRNDATIDNNATYKEITYLVSVYKTTKNPAYLQAAEKGIRFLLKAQEPNGGWPQYYPDTSLYRAQVTFNDNAMMNTMNILNDVAKRQNGFDVVDQSLIKPSAEAVQRGIKCILKTQIKVDGKLTAWNQQYDRRTLEPVMARKFELVGISAQESVGIVEFLMQIEHPSAEIKNAIKSAVEWLDKVKIPGYRFENVKDASQPKGIDRVLVADPNAVIWARYYEIGTNRPFFSGRNSVKVYDVKQIEHERRTGYAWYGTWPQKLISKEYPDWAKKNGLSN